MLLKELYMRFKGVGLSELWQTYNEMPLIKGAYETMRGLKDRSYEAVIISSGVPDFLVQDIARRLGADMGYGIEVTISEDTLSGEVGGELARPGGKGALMERLLKERGLRWEEVVVVADDPNNLNIMKKAGVSIGVNASYPVRKSATYLVDGDDLGEVIRLLEVGEGEVDVWEGWLGEARRKLVHTLAAVVPFVALLAPLLIIASLCVMAAIYSVSEWTRLNGRIVPVIGDITISCIRREERRHFVLAPVTLSLGIVISLIIFPHEVATAVILILAFADSAASLVGRARGTVRLPYNRTKSVQGSAAAFAVACLCSAFYFPAGVAVVAAFVSSLIESLPIRDDNIAIPVGTGIVLTAMSG